MAKLHSEIRIRAVNGLGDAQEGNGSKFAENDVVYSVADSAFKKRNNSAYDSGNPQNAWDTVATGGGGLAALVDDGSPQLGATLDANGNDIDMGANVITDAKVAQWDQAHTWGDHGGAGYLTSIAADSINDTHIDFGTDATQVSSDDVPEGSTNLYYTDGRADTRATLRIQAANLDTLNDVQAGAADGQILKWNNAAGEWQPGDEASGGASDLSGLSDVLTNAPADGHILQYVSGNNRFENASFEEIARTKYEITANGSSHYRFSGPGFSGSEDDPKMYLVRGRSYSFQNNAGVSHPFQIQTTTGAIENVVGNRYNIGITGLDGNRQLQSGQNMVWEVMMDAPDVLYYHCGQHSSMNGEIRILDEGSGGGAGNTILEGDTKVQVLDTGSDGQIEFFTENSHRWSVTSDGHFLPHTHNAFDIGSAEKKVRDLYVSDSSIWIGDRHKLAINSEGEMLFLKRKVGRIPSGANVEDDTIEKIRTQGGLAGDKTLENMTLEDWRQYATARGIPMYQLYDKDETLDWDNVENDNAIQKAAAPSTSTAVIRKFHVAVDNKNPNLYPEAGGSGNAYYIDGRHAPELRLRKGTYRFYQRHFSNATHPLVFRTNNESNGHESVSAKLWYGYTDVTDPANPSEIRQSEYDGSSWVFNTTPYGDGGLTFDPTNANWDHYVDLTITDATPREFYFACGAHSKMGWKIINESAAIGGGGANSTGELNDVADSAPADGEALVYNASNNRYEPKPLLADLHNQFASRRIDFDPSGGGHGAKDLTPTLNNNFGGRIVVDGTDFDPAQGDKLTLDLGSLYSLNPLPKTMNFEIYMSDAGAFEIELLNSVNAGDKVLKSDIQTNKTVPWNSTTEKIEVLTGGKFIILYCNGTNWHYEFRSGL